MYSTILPHLVVLNLTINDWIAATNTATYLANMQTKINKIKTAGCDLILFTGAPSKITSVSAAQQQTYVDIVKGLAATNNVNLVCLTDRWGSWEAKVGVYYNADPLHPIAAGCADEAQAIYDLMPH